MEKLGGKSSLNESRVVAAEVASLKKFGADSRKILPIDSAEKAGLYRKILKTHWGELALAKKIKN